MTRLRKMMLEELQRRNYSAITMRNYLRVVTEFTKYFGKPPDRLGLGELRTYQAYLLRERKLNAGYRGQSSGCASSSSRLSSVVSSVTSCLTLRTGVGCRRC